MADAWQSAWVEVLPDFSNFRREATPGITSILSGAGDAGGVAGSRSFGNSFVGGIGKLAIPIAGAFAALGIGNMIADAVRTGLDFAVDAVALASGLEQSVGGVDAVFKDSAATIHEWAEAAAQGVGLSQNAYNEYATVVGAQLKNLGIPLVDVAGQTGTLIGLGADLAAQFGGPTSQAVEAISAALRGESDPIERYGVSINQTAVSARLAALGLEDLTGEQQQAARAQAVLSLLMEQTSDAQGAFGREADTLAGKQARLNAEWENARTTIGEAFMPVAQTLTDILANDLLPTIQTLVQENGPALTTAFQDAIPVFGQLVDEVLPKLPELLTTVGESLPGIIDAATQLLPPFVDFLGSLANGASQIATFFTELSAKLDNGAQQWSAFFTGFGGALENGGNQIGAFFGTIGAAFANGWAQISSFFQGVGAAFANGANQIGSFAATVGQKVAEVIGFVGSIPGRISEFFAGAGTWLISSGRALIQGFIDGITGMIGRVGDAVGSVLEWARGFFPNSPADRGPFSGSGWNDLARSGSAVMTQFYSGFARPDLTGALTPVLSGAPAPVRNAYATAAATSPLSMPRSLRLVVGGREFDAYVEEMADGRVLSAAHADDVAWKAGTKSL